MYLLLKFIVMPLLLVLLVILGIRYIVKKISDRVGESNKKRNEAFKQEYLTEAIGAEKLQKKLSRLFYGRWARLILSYLMMAAIVLAVVLLARAGSTSNMEHPSVLLWCVLIAMAGFILRKTTGRAKVKTKQLIGLIVKPVLEEVFGSDVKYESWNRIPDNLIGSSGFLHGYKFIDGSDLVRGFYEGVSIMFSDIKVIREEEYYDAVDQQSKTKYVTIFKGFWIVAEFDRELVPAALNIHEEGNSGSIRMESIEFNNKFSVYCPDGHTAFYILTPHFMERLLEVEKKVKGRMRLQFDNNKLQIAVDTGKDQFEAGHFRVPDVAEMQRRFREEVGQITGVMDEILRHERLFGEAGASPERRPETEQQKPAAK